MLCLRRSVGESIDVITPSGDLIRIMTVCSRHGRMSIGVDAPASYGIWRSEIPPDKRRMQQFPNRQHKERS